MESQKKCLSTFKWAVHLSLWDHDLRTDKTFSVHSTKYFNFNKNVTKWNNSSIQVSDFSFLYTIKI